MLPCSVSFIQGSDRCLSFEGLPEKAFEHLTNLNYLYLANNKVRGSRQGGGACCPVLQALSSLSSMNFHQGLSGLAAGSLLLLRHGPGLVVGKTRTLCL